MVVPLKQAMQAVGKRFGLSADYAVDIDDLGRIQSLKTTFTQDAGCSLNESVNGLTQGAMPNCYMTDTWSLAGQCVITDCPSNTFMRCPGTLEGIAMIENIMDQIRYATKGDEIEVRLANMSANHAMRQLCAQFVQETDYAGRKAAVDAWNACNEWCKKGIAVMPMVWSAGYYGTIDAKVIVHHGDGSVVINHAGIEMGQGINTKCAQVAARELGVPMELVSVRPTDNVSTTNAFCTGGSVTSESACYVSELKKNVATFKL